MRERNGVRYIIKVFEAQWDKLHDETVKPFFEQLKRDTNENYLRRNGANQETPGHDALFRYVVFQNAEGLKDALYRHDQGVEQPRKIAYFACHGKRGVISAVQDISRRRLKNILAPLTSYDGLYFGACDFVNRETAEVLLGGSQSKWIAGYESWTPWLEGMLCDMMFFRLLLSGRFMRPKTNARWEPIRRPDEVAHRLYEQFPQANRDLRFSLYYRKPERICSNQYSRVVTKEGNLSAQKLLEEVFERTDRKWRGIGNIPSSGFRLKDEFSDYDAEKIFNVEYIVAEESPLCIAGEVLQGIKKPVECSAFGKVCKPEHPLGAPMVSTEGACAAYFHYGKKEMSLRAK